ncbi:MAG: transporter [Phycisphaerales bacterium]
MTRPAALAAAVGAIGAPALAQPAPDKSGYTILNPTPPELRRPLAADRPDATESPYTVDAGAFQIELSFVEYAFNRENTAREVTLSVAPINIKAGITNDLDLQLTLNPYERAWSDVDDDADGVGSLGLRAKVNLWGNDDGPTAMALLPYVVFPTGDDDVSADEFEYGLVVPFAAELPGGWGLGLQGEIGAVSAGSGGGTDLLLSHTAVLGRDIVGDLAGYVEYIGEVAFDGDAEYRPSVAGGLTYALTEDAQLDIGVVVGLDNPDTEDVRFFSGITLRF